MKKKFKLGLILTVLCLALLCTSACDSLGGGDGEVIQQQVEVTRGDITVTVTGSGKLETSREARLTFGSAGKLDKILVEEGDVVKKGDVLARLDTSTLELAVTKAESDLAQAQISLTQAKLAVTQAQLAQHTAEYDLKNTQDMEDALKLALLNAQITLDQAERNLRTGIAATDYDLVRAELDKAKVWYGYVEDSLQEAAGDEVDDWLLAFDRAKEKLDIAQANYDDALSGYNVAEVAIRKQQVEAAEMGVSQAQKGLDDLTEQIEIKELQVESAIQSVAQAEQSVGLANQSVDLAQQSLEEAQRQLDEATILATFDGIVAQVLAKEGDIIPSPSMVPTTIIHLINPKYLELVVEVDEIDIPLVELDQEAVVSVDALLGIEFQGVVTAVYPVPKEEGGVVLYDVKVGFDAPENSRIRVGMSASADIVIDEHSDVLLVPSRAIKQDSQGGTIVKVMSNGEIQERPVVVGLDDGLRTEILSGLSDGETVVVEVRARSAPSMGF